MNYYKDSQNNVFAYSDIQTPKDGLTKITEQEALELTNPPRDPEYKTQFSPLEYLDRFSEDEQLAVVAATMTNPAVKLWYDRMLAASFVSLDDPRTEAGIDALITAELVAADRKSALMAPELVE